MTDGFLGYKSSFMLDVVALSLVLVVPLLVWSLYLVKVMRRYGAHRRLQTLLGLVLLVAVSAFEIDMRMQGGIDGILAKRPVPLTSDQRSFFNGLLAVHLVFAVSTVLLWGLTLILAWKRTPHPPAPSPHSRLHKRLGWMSAIDITLTAITGLMVYYFGIIR
ncbi:MAG: DUF420 domain-containing protein [Planctomycetales bacterium]|nr:DUF420 domain-containing protein [Planctomycetales bacterium]